MNDNINTQWLDCLNVLNFNKYKNNWLMFFEEINFFLRENIWLILQKKKKVLCSNSISLAPRRRWTVLCGFRKVLGNKNLPIYIWITIFLDKQRDEPTRLIISFAENLSSLLTNFWEWKEREVIHGRRLTNYEEVNQEKTRIRGKTQKNNPASFSARI